MKLKWNIKKLKINLLEQLVQQIEIKLKLNNYKMSFEDIKKTLSL